MEKNLREFWSKHLTAEQALRNLVSCVAVCLVKQYFLQCGTARQTPCRIFHLWRRILLERTTQPWPFLLMARRSPARFRAGFFMPSVCRSLLRGLLAPRAASRYADRAFRHNPSPAAASRFLWIFMIFAPNWQRMNPPSAPGCNCLPPMWRS